MSERSDDAGESDAATGDGDSGQSGAAPARDDAGLDREGVEPDRSADASARSSDRSGVDNLLRALDVATQAKRGLAVGVLVAAATYYFFVVASGGSPYSTAYLLALAGVLAFTVSLLAAFAFTVAAAYRLSRRLD
jgi:hypothetical protein